MHYDIKRYTSYDSFLKGNHPYNKSNAYPLGDRKYSQKHFRLAPNGDLHIMYANRLEMDKATNPTPTIADRDRAARYPKRHLATVHPDNSITIHNANDMGDYKLLEAVTGFSMVQESKRGGLVIRAYEGRVDKPRHMHLGFKGLRIMLDTGAVHPECKYFVNHRTINRVTSQEYMKQYDEFLATYPIMLRASSLESIRELMTEIRNSRKMIEYIGYADECIKKQHYVDAAVSFAMSVGINPWWYLFNSSKTDQVHTEMINRINKNFKRGMLCLAPYPEKVFEIKRYEGGAYCPTSQWPLNVYLDGTGTPLHRL